MIIDNFVFYKKYEINNKKIKLYLKKNSKNKTKYVKYKNKMIKLIEYKKKIKKVNKKKGGSFVYNDYDPYNPDDDPYYDPYYNDVDYVSIPSYKPSCKSSSSSISLPKPFKSFSSSPKTPKTIKAVKIENIPKVLPIRIINLQPRVLPINIPKMYHQYQERPFYWNGLQHIYTGGKKSKITKN